MENSDDAVTATAAALTTTAVAAVVEKKTQQNTWGTWEELLLGCAVHRHGTDNWDSVAMEIQKRSTNLHVLTPNSCQEKYNDLQRRFSIDKNDVNNNKINNTKKTTTVTMSVPWLDELKKLRVAELKKEVERHDLSIVSLQSKVEKLKEERESDERETEKPDLEITVGGGDDEAQDDGEKVEGGGKPASTGKSDSERENRSVNESNSTNPKRELEPIEQVGKESVRVGGEEAKQGREEDSCYGSCGSSAAKETESGRSDRVETRIAKENDSAELYESATESKGSQSPSLNSDMQSFASLSMVNKEEEEPDNDDQSSPHKTKRRVTAVESQPLIGFLEIVRSHKFGSIFERRLESQDTPGYGEVIRQHMDLETIRTRVQDGLYSGCSNKFYRDLLLVFSNALVFFSRKSSESKMAVALRQLVLKEIALKPSKANLPQKVESSVPILKLEPEQRSKSLAEKTKLSVPLIACRKRSSLTAKAAGTSSGSEKKREKMTTLLDDKPALDWKQQDKSSEVTEEQKKKRTNDRSATKSNKNSKTRAPINSNKNTDTNANNTVSSKEATINENSETKTEKGKKNNASSNSKKQNAAKFLSRMKMSSSSNNESVKTAGKSPDTGKSGQDQKKNSNANNSKVDAKKESWRSRAAAKRANEQSSSPSKKNVGRPPKKGAATPLPAKRGRDTGDSEAAGSSGHTKKRNRR